jgi:hypothetical protein
MDPAFFYTYVNTLIHNNGMSKYNAIIEFMNDPSIIPTYKLIPEVNTETNHAIELMHGPSNNQINNQYVHDRNNNQNIHNIDNIDDEFDNPPPSPPRLRRS